MARRNEDDPLEITMDTGIEINLDPHAELRAVLDDLESLLKNGEVIGALTTKGVNGSIALLAVQGLRNYLEGKKDEAADDLATVAEEVRARRAIAGEPSDPSDPGGTSGANGAG